MSQEKLCEPAKVYFADLRARKATQNRTAKIKKLFEAAGFDEIVAKDDLTAIKVHFGERGCDTHISPTHVRTVVERIKARGGRPFVTDTNTLYSGSRHNAVEHIATAVEHGFDYAVLGAPVIIADGPGQHQRDRGAGHGQTFQLGQDRRRHRTGRQHARALPFQGP